MIIALYDGTFRGYLTVVYTFLGKDGPGVIIKIRNEEQPSLFGDETVEIETDTEKYNRVIKEIRMRISAEAVNIVKSAFLSETNNIENCLFTFIRRGLQTGAAVIHALADDAVDFVIKASRKTFFEANKYKGIIRFSDGENNLKYAQIAPDTNVIPLIASHFKNRFPCEKWIIHDTGRGLILMHDGAGSLELFEANALDATGCGIQAAADCYTELWKSYFRVMSVESRKNSQLQRQFLPIKRRKYVIEFL